MPFALCMREQPSSRRQKASKQPPLNPCIHHKEANNTKPSAISLLIKNAASYPPVPNNIARCKTTDDLNVVVGDGHSGDDELRGGQGADEALMLRCRG